MTRSMSWTDVNNVVTVFDGSAGILLMAGPVGLESATPANSVDEYIAFDGAVLVDRRYPVRPVALPLALNHVDRVETVVAALATMLQGPGKLTWADDLNVRTLRQVIYEAGIDGSGETTLTDRLVVVSLLALDPWWYGTATLQVLSTSATTGFDAAIGFDAFFPFDGGNTLTIVVPGDTEAYPVITVVGPVTTLTVGAGLTSWSLAAALAGGSTIVVDHRPGSRGPSLNGGAVDWSLLSAASRLFTIGPGATSVVSGVSGATGATSITMSYEPRYLTP